jgi:hypothetical protein
MLAWSKGRVLSMSGQRPLVRGPLYVASGTFSSQVVSSMPLRAPTKSRLSS